MSPGKPPFKVNVYTDGGARGNPGPAAAGVVIESSDDRTVLFEKGVYLGEATNNVAEYRGLLIGLKQGCAMGANAVEVFSDSELLVRQMIGVYRVRNEGLRPLYEQAKELIRGLDHFAIRHIPREQNGRADQLVNRALNLKRDVEGS